MRRHLFVYINFKDICFFQRELSEAGLLFYDLNGTRVQSVPAITKAYEEYRVGRNGSAAIVYSPCWGDFLQPACFCEDCDNLSKEFKIIRKILQNNFNKPSWFYYGEGIYRDWCNYAYDMPLLERQSFTVKPERLDVFMEDIKAAGYIIKNNKVPVSKKDILNKRGDSFIVYSEGASIFYDTVSLSQFGVEMVYYSIKSDCLFISKNRSQYDFILDPRQANNKSATCKMVFDSLLSMQAGIA